MPIDARVVGLFPPPDPIYFSPPSNLPHQGLLYLLSDIKLRCHDCELVLLDSQIMTDTEIAAALYGDILCVSPTIMSIRSAIKLAEIAKYNGMYVLFGGECSRMLQNTLLSDFECIDAIGHEKDGLGIIEYIKTNGVTIPNSWTTKHKIGRRFATRNSLLIIKDIDYDLCNFDRYQNKNYNFQIVGQSGCLWKIRNDKNKNVCSFCSRSDTYYCSLDIKNYCKSIYRLKKRFGSCSFSDRSESFSQNEKWLRSLVKYHLQNSNDILIDDCLCRIDEIDEISLNSLRLLGISQIGIGVESLENHVLKKIGKGHTKEQVVSKIKMAGSKGLSIWMNFILGLPGYSKQAQYDFKNFVDQLLKSGIEFSVTANLIQPMPGSKLFSEIKNSNILLNEDYYEVDRLQYLYFKTFFGDTLHSYEIRRKELLREAECLWEYSSHFPGEGWRKEEVI